MFGKFLRWIDIPPSWLALCVAVAWGLDLVIPGLGFGWGWSRVLGTGLVLLGLLVMGAALWEFLRAKTTFIPRQVPTAFLKRGIYRLTRNPIYLGDAMVLAGLILRWDVLAALPLVPAFAVLITARFIWEEEAGLIAQFGDEFTEWAAKVRRWL